VTLGEIMNIRRSWLVGALVAAVVAIPGAALATHYFTDVRDNHPHAAGIEFVADVGITSGCSPTQYCPGQAVTRAQMATFLYRSSGWSPSVGPVANALLVNGYLTFDGFEYLELQGGSAHECVAPEPVGLELGTVIVTHDLTSSPDGQLSPAAINVAVDYDAEPAPDAYAVCFQTLDGSPLPAGEYETVFHLSVDLNPFLAEASAASVTDIPDLERIQAALEAKASARH
jgi:hypothetical protein